MKNILFIAITMFFITGCVTYQYNTTGSPENKDNTIVINTDKSDEQNYNDFGRYLISKGFTFENKDKEFKTYVTRPRTVSGQMQYKLSVTCISSNIQVRAELTTITFGSYDVIWVNWKYRNDVGNIHLKAFKTFFPILYEYSNNISFIVN